MERSSSSRASATPACSTSCAAAAVLCTADFADQVPRGHRGPGHAEAAAGLRADRPAAVSRRRRRPAAVTGETGISPQAMSIRRRRSKPASIVEAGAVIGPGAAIGSGTVIAPNAVIGQHCQIGRDCYVGPGRQRPVCADRQPRHHPWRRPDRPGRFRLRRRRRAGRSASRRSAASSSRTMSRSAPTPRSTAAPWPTRSSAKAPRSTIWCRSPTMSASAAAASSPAIAGLSGSVTLGDFVMLGGGVGIADHVDDRRRRAACGRQRV